MKKLLTVIIVIVLCIGCVGCDYNKSGLKNSESDNRIEYVFNDGFTIIVRDTRTGVEYISRANAGTCVVVNETGKPYIER